MVVQPKDASTGLPIGAPGTTGYGRQQQTGKRKYTQEGAGSWAKYGLKNTGMVRPEYLRVGTNESIGADPFATAGEFSTGFNPLPSGETLIDQYRQRQIAESQIDPVTGLPIDFGAQGRGGSHGPCEVQGNDGDLRESRFRHSL